jgi:hypothetical protein
VDEAKEPVNARYNDYQPYRSPECPFLHTASSICGLLFYVRFFHGLL